MPLYKGDKVVVNFTKWGHNVVNAISEVTNVLPGQNYQITGPEGAATKDKPWVLKLQAPEMVQHFPKLKVGDEVFILSYPKSTYKDHIISDERATKQKVMGVDGHGDIRLTHWWYARGDITTNPEAMNAAAIERHEHCYYTKANPNGDIGPSPLAKPKTKYKVINGGSRDLVSF